jgi:hypothetical protein
VTKEHFSHRQHFSVSFLSGFQWARYPTKSSLYYKDIFTANPLFSQLSIWFSSESDIQPKAACIIKTTSLSTLFRQLSIWFPVSQISNQKQPVLQSQLHCQPLFSRLLSGFSVSKISNQSQLYYKDIFTANPLFSQLSIWFSSEPDIQPKAACIIKTTSLPTFLSQASIRTSTLHTPVLPIWHQQTYHKPGMAEACLPSPTSKQTTQDKMTYNTFFNTKLEATRSYKP